MTPTTTPIAVPLEGGTVTIRGARSTDESALIRLAGRDTKPVPRGEVIVAELDGELLAARSLTDGTAIADPFRRTARTAELLARAARSATSSDLGDLARPTWRRRLTRARAGGDRAEATPSVAGSTVGGADTGLAVLRALFARTELEQR